MFSIKLAKLQLQLLNDRIIGIGIIYLISGSIDNNNNTAETPCTGIGTHVYWNCKLKLNIFYLILENMDNNDKGATSAPLATESIETLIVVGLYLLK